MPLLPFKMLPKTQIPYEITPDQFHLASDTPIIPRTPLYSRPLIFLPFLITGHFFRASIAIHTCSRRHHLWEGWLGLVLFSFFCWLMPSTSLEISLRSYYWALNKWKPCNDYKYSNRNLKKTFKQ